MERLHFCTLSYDDYSSYFKGKVDVGIILTMNAPRDMYESWYKPKFENMLQSFRGLNGSFEIYPCCDTLQVNDYSKYNMAGFNEEHKKLSRETNFPKDLEQAFKLGARLGRR